MACREGCPTKSHESYSDCLRDSGIRIAYCNSTNGYDYTKQRKWENELSAYRAARSEGLAPVGTEMKQIDAAKRVADQGV